MCLCVCVCVGKEHRTKQLIFTIISKDGLAISTHTHMHAHAHIFTTGVLGASFGKVVAPTAGSSFFIQEMIQRHTHHALDSLGVFTVVPTSMSPLAAAALILLSARNENT